MVDSIRNPIDSNTQPIQLDPIERQAFEQQSKEQRFIEYNQQVIPTTFNEMLSASFDSTYQHGVGRKAFNLAQRLTSTAPTVSAKELNERYGTDIFKYDVSEEQAGELIALVKRKEELNRIISSGDGSFWSDKVPWFAGSMAGWFADPTSVPMMYAGGLAGNAVKSKMLDFGASAVKAGIAGYAAESLTTGVIQAAASQALAPEALEERSVKQFGEDVAIGAIGDITFGAIGAGAKKIYKVMAKAKPDQGELGNKAMTSSQKKNASIQAYSQEAFKDGKKIDAEKLIKSPEAKVKEEAKATLPEGIVFVKKTPDGAIVDSSIADKKSLEATNNIDDVADGTGKAVAFSIAPDHKVFDVKTDQSGFINLFKKFVTDRNKQKYEFKTEIGEFFKLIDELQSGGLDSPSIAKVMKAKDPTLYSEFMDYIREQGYSIVDFGDRKLVLNPELLPNEEVQLNKEMLEPISGNEELASKLTSNEMDIEYSKEALDDVAVANTELVAEVNRKFDEDASALINELSTKEGESSIIKKDVDSLKEEIGIFTQIESAIKAFTKCVLKG